MSEEKKYTAAEVRQEVLDGLENHLGYDKQKVSVVNETNIVADLGADSLDRVELVMWAEEHFGIEISDDVAETVHTVGELIAVVTKELGDRVS